MVAWNGAIRTLLVTLFAAGDGRYHNRHHTSQTILEYMMMDEMERTEFARRFRLRQLIFLEAVQQLAKPGKTWQIYVGSEQVHDDGRVTCQVVARGQPSMEIETLVRYCRQIGDQGYDRLKIVFGKY